MKKTLILIVALALASGAAWYARDTGRLPQLSDLLRGMTRAEAPAPQPVPAPAPESPPPAPPAPSAPGSAADQAEAAAEAAIARARQTGASQP